MSPKANIADLGKLSSVHEDQPNRKVIRKVPRKQMTGLIAYVLPEVAQSFRIVAAENGKTQQALLIEGINAVFAKYGKDQIAS